jgi:hypothetical protein
MRRTVALLVLGSAVAQAQPARVPPAYAYKPQLTDDDRDVLARGEITNDQQIGGGVVALMFGFGTGQAVEGRWRDTGWMFTLGDTVAGAALMAGIISTIGGGPGCHTCARDTPPVLIGGADQAAHAVLSLVHGADAEKLNPMPESSKADA